MNLLHKTISDLKSTEGLKNEERERAIMRLRQALGIAKENSPEPSPDAKVVVKKIQKEKKQREVQK